MWRAAICGSSGLAVKAPGCLIVTPGRDKRLWQTIRIARLVGTGSSRCNNKTARGSLPHIIAYEGSTALSTARFWLKPEQETRRATPSTVQLLTAGLCRHVHRRWPGNILVRCCGTLTLRSGAARSAVSWSQPNAHADLLSRRTPTLATTIRQARRLQQEQRFVPPVVPFIIA